MNKVTVIIEMDSDDQYTQVTRSGEMDVDLLLAQCIRRVADTFNSQRLDVLAEAAAKVARTR